MAKKPKQIKSVKGWTDIGPNGRLYSMIAGPIHERYGKVVLVYMVKRPGAVRVEIRVLPKKRKRAKK